MHQLRQEYRASAYSQGEKVSCSFGTRQKLYACHVQYDSDDFKEAKGEVISSRNNPSLLGLRNDSNNTWEAILPNGSSKGYPNGQVIKLGKGIKINFGNGNVAEVI